MFPGGSLGLFNGIVLLYFRCPVVVWSLVRFKPRGTGGPRFEFNSSPRHGIKSKGGSQFRLVCDKISAFLPLTPTMKRGFLNSTGGRAALGANITPTAGTSHRGFLRASSNISATEKQIIKLPYGVVENAGTRETAHQRRWRSLKRLVLNHRRPSGLCRPGGGNCVGGERPTRSIDAGWCVRHSDHRERYVLMQYQICC